MSKNRSYVFTINNDTFEDLCHLMDMEAKYFCFGFETGEQGTPHIQGYVQYANPITFTRAKVRIGERSHVEIAKGTPKQNIDYCSKDGDFYEFGEKPTVTATFEQIEAAIKDPKSNPHMYRMYSKVYEEIKQREVKNSDIKTEFYTIDPIHDLIQEINEIYSLENFKEVAVITKMEELIGYENPDMIILDPESDWQLNKKLLNYYPRGVPMNIKNGYLYKTYKPQKFIMRTNEPQFYPLYKRL